MAMKYRCTLVVLKSSMAMLLAALACIWTVRLTRSWKRSWHEAEDRASTTVFSDSGLTVVVYCFPVLAVASLAYVYLHLTSKTDQESRKRRSVLMANLTNPITVMKCSIGIVSTAELLIATLFIIFLAWTYYSNVSSSFKMMTPYKSLKLNKWQLKMMYVGVRIGSLSEACLVLLFLPILRGMAVFRVFGVQFEASVRYHVWIGNLIILLSLLHGIIVMFIWGVKKSLLKEIVKWQSVGRVNIAGAMALTTGLIIWITSLPQIRRKQFQLFYLTHHLYIVFILFFLIHAGDKHFYLVFAGVLLFAVDKLLRIVQSRGTTSPISASILPNRALKLTLLKHPCMGYTPTSIIFVKVPIVSRFQWHPFSITSSSNMDNSELSILIKSHGQWTTGLFNLLNSVIDTGSSDHLKDIQIAVEGPYGPATFEYRRYKSLVLIAGGSGISPFLSILQDIASRNGDMNKNPIKVQLIYVVKKVEDLSMLAVISPLLLENLKMKLFVTQENSPPVTAEKILQDLSLQIKTIASNKASSKGALSMPEGLLWKALITAVSFAVFLASLIILSYVFLHQESKSSSKKKKDPSWIGDLFALCSLTIAASCCAMATMISRWKRTVSEGQQVPHRQSVCHENTSAKVQGTERHEIEFGIRPNLVEMLDEIEFGTEEEEVGIFVCGPASMNESVASFCIANRQCRKKDQRKQKCNFNVHFINFSL
ncbi:ferric reduction oxidase 8, mitochondrial-like [Zingiber officinale]|uniref:ferric reduction oxidase 8, mitochondrial-like n=1 Tax=Zingiber officinale TaxID=94328 RepID=UPI001C4C4039|nr:ferric reduction oxidase 8, mitochondrial-like [Zingiber officinale]